MRIIKTIIIVLLILGLALSAIRFLFLDQIVGYALQKVGVKVLSVHVSDLSWKLVHIDALSATYALSGGDKYSVEFHDVSLYYALAEILTNRKISRVDIEEITIHRAQTSMKSGTDFTIPDHIELLKDELRAKFPLKNITIKGLLLQGDFPSQLIDKNIQLKASFEKEVIQAEVDMELASDIKINIKIQSPDVFHGVVNIVLWKQKNEIAGGTFLLHPKNLSGRLISQVEPLGEVLSQSGLLLNFPAGSGSVLLDFEIPLNPVEKLFSVRATISDPVFPGLSASRIQLQLFGRFDGGRLLFGEKSKFQTENLHLGKTGLEELLVGLRGSCIRQQGRILFELADQQSLQIKGLVAEKVKVPGLDLHFDESVSLSLQDKVLSVAGGGLRFDPVQIQEGDRSYDVRGLNCNDFEVKKSTTDIELFTAYTFSTVVIGNKWRQLPLRELSGMFKLKEKDLVGTLQFSPGKLPARFQVNFEHNPVTASGKIKVKTDRRINLDGDGDSLANLFTPWPYPFNLDGGNVAVLANASWGFNEKPRLSAFVSVTGGRGYYKQVLFNGLKVRQDLAVLPQLYSKTKGSFALKQLIGGIDVTDVNADVNLLAVESGPLPELQVNNFRASLFDGTVRSREVFYDLNNPDSKFSVDVEAMDLGKLVEIIKMDSLYVTGLVSGTIPVRIKEDEISVENGSLYSNIPGGEIRYTPGKMNQAGLTAYALKAVEELQYQTLHVTANYQPSGQLDLDIGLKGVSPGLETNRPVHLNIHAEQNLPALLQSLRFSKGLTEELDKRVKQHYN